MKNDFLNTCQKQLMQFTRKKLLFVKLHIKKDKKEISNQRILVYKYSNTRVSYF